MKNDKLLHCLDYRIAAANKHFGIDDSPAVPWLQQSHLQARLEMLNALGNVFLACATVQA